MREQRLVFAVSGASGMNLAYEVLCAFAEQKAFSIHLIISENAKKVLHYETGGEITEEDFGAIVTESYRSEDIAAAPASGSWRSQGMVICPCSMATLAAIATGVGTTLIHRAADCMLKERRPLILVPRETPLHAVHLKNMLVLAELGAVIMPYMPAFYIGTTEIRESMRNFAGRILDQIGYQHSLCRRWPTER
ncbi:MAG: UbiX family flavin prenyltransferase [Desulfovibrio sp.]|nr:UbiX family flavin prenyltransferase [Desulfovibrio sp.]